MRSKCTWFHDKWLCFERGEARVKTQWLRGRNLVIYTVVYTIDHSHRFHTNRNRIFLRGYCRGMFQLSPAGEVDLYRSDSVFIPKGTSGDWPLTSESAIIHHSSFRRCTIHSPEVGTLTIGAKEVG